MRFKALRHQPSDAARKSGYDNEGQLPDTLPDSRSRPISDVGNLACDRLQCSNELSFADRQPYIRSLGSRITSCGRVLRAHDAIRTRNAAKQSNVSTSMGRLLVRPSMTACKGDQRCGADAGIEPAALAWEARVLPLYESRVQMRLCTTRCEDFSHCVLRF